MAHLPRRDPLLDALVRDAFAAIEGGERCRDSRDLPLVVVEIRGDSLSGEERTRASRRASHFFEALLQRVSDAHGDGCGAGRIHNVLHCITGGVTRHEGSLWRISHKLEVECANFGSKDHADWVRGASRMLDEDGRAGRGVERWDGFWSWGDGVRMPSLSQGAKKGCRHDPWTGC
jgi:hypothetical protein